MDIFKASPEAIQDAAAALRAGALVAFPTETVYGLGADAANEAAVAKVFAAKGRPRLQRRKAPNARGPSPTAALPLTASLSTSMRTSSFSNQQAT